MKIGKRRVYIAGPMTGIANYNRRAFFEAAQTITDKTCLVPVHTAWMCIGYDYETYMDMSLDLLELCEFVTTLPGWEDSIGAQREILFAQKNGIPHVEFGELFVQFPKYDY